MGFADDVVERLKAGFLSEPFKYSFFAVMIVAEFIILIAGLITGGQAISDLLFEVKDAVGTDYFNCLRTEMNMSKDIYPPLAQVFYLFLGTLSIPTTEVTGKELIDQQMAFTVFCIYTIVVFYLLFISMGILKKGTRLEKHVFFFLMILSVPFIFGLERGNIIFLVLVFVLFFLRFYESESRPLRIFAYVSLGIATGLKIYPVLFGLLVLRRWDVREILTCVAIGALIFFVPFLFSNGSIMQQLENIFSYTEGMTAFIHFDLINMENTLMCVFSMLIVDVQQKTLHDVSLAIGVLALLIALLNRKAEAWVPVCLISLAAVLCIGFRPIYAMIMLTPALIKFLDSRPSLNLANVLFLACFILMFVPMLQYFFAVGGVQSITSDPIGVIGLTTLVEGISSIILLLALIAISLPGTVRSVMEIIDKAKKTSADE